MQTRQTSSCRIANNSWWEALAYKTFHATLTSASHTSDAIQIILFALAWLWTYNITTTTTPSSTPPLESSELTSFSLCVLSLPRLKTQVGDPFNDQLT